MRRLLLVLLGFAAFSEAPSVFADSPRAHDCIVASEASLTLRNSHKTRAARGQLLICSAPSCPAEIRVECARRIDQANTAVPTVVFSVKGGAGEELSAVKVTMDNEVVADHLDGSALALDPGSHVFTFQIPDQPPVTETLILHEGEKDRHEAVTIGQPAARPTIVNENENENDSDGGHGRRVVGIVIGSVGLAGVVVGGIFGGLTFSSWNQANTACPKHVGCGPQAISEGANASTFGTVSTVAFIAGGLLLAGGLTLYFTAPRDHAASVGVELAPGGAGVVGRF